MLCWWRLLPVCLAIVVAPVAAAAEDEEPDLREPGEVVEEASADEETPLPPTRVYRSVDEQGRVRFSDRPGDAADSREVELPRPNTVTITPSPSAAAVDTAAGDEPVDVQVRITSPADGDVLQNPPAAVPVKASVSPPLPGGYQLRLLSNGEQQQDMALPRPDRGSYTLLVEVLNDRGAVVAQSESVTIQVQRASRLLPATRKSQ